MLSRMEQAQLAFKELARVIRIKPGSRRHVMFELAQSARIIEPLWGSPMLRVPMAPRRERRFRQGREFRPVYGYTGGGLKR